MPRITAAEKQFEQDARLTIEEFKLRAYDIIFDDQPNRPERIALSFVEYLKEVTEMATAA